VGLRVDGDGASRFGPGRGRPCGRVARVYLRRKVKISEWSNFGVERLLEAANGDEPKTKRLPTLYGVGQGEFWTALAFGQIRSKSLISICSGRNSVSDPAYRNDANILRVWISSGIGQM